MDAIAISLLALAVMTGLSILIVFLGLAAILLIFLDILLRRKGLYGREASQQDWVNEQSGWRRSRNEVREYIKRLNEGWK